MKYFLPCIAALLLVFCAGPVYAKAINASQCSCRGIALHGKVKFVKHGADFKVKIVNTFPDLKVQKVKHFPDKCGQWQIVNTFPDFTVEIVDTFPDFTIQYVNTFPGVR